MSNCCGVFKCCSKRVDDDRDRKLKPQKRKRKEQKLLEMNQHGMLTDEEPDVDQDNHEYLKTSSLLDGNKRSSQTLD